MQGLWRDQPAWAYLPNWSLNSDERRVGVRWPVGSVLLYSGRGWGTGEGVRWWLERCSSEWLVGEEMDGTEVGFLESDNLPIVSCALVSLVGGIVWMIGWNDSWIEKCGWGIRCRKLSIVVANIFYGFRLSSGPFNFDAGQRNRHSDTRQEIVNHHKVDSINTSPTHLSYSSDQVSSMTPYLHLVHWHVPRQIYRCGAIKNPWS